MKTNIIANWRANSILGFLSSKCSMCEKIFYPTQSFCTHCGGNDLKVYQLRGPFVLQEIVESFQETKIPMLDANLPISFGIIQVDQGNLILSLVETSHLLVGDEVEPFFVRLRGETSTEPFRYTIGFQAKSPRIVGSP